MNINATLLVQAGNFFIAYLLFRIILLKPACEVVDQENVFLNSLHEQLELGQEQFEKKQLLQRKQWLQVHEFYKKNQPIMPNKQMVFQGICTPIFIEPFSDQQIEDLYRQVGQKIAMQIGKIK